MRKIKRITSIILAALMVMSLFVAVPITASAVPPTEGGGGTTYDPAVLTPTTAGDDYLTFTAEEANSSVTLEFNYGSNFKYNKNNSGWQSYTAGTQIELANVGDYVRFSGKDTEFNDYNHVSLTGKVACSGSVMSLRLDDNGEVQGLSNYCFSYMFDGCAGLTTAPELPETTLARNCYFSMFRGCTSLTEAPVLPATTLAKYCYAYMFRECTSLTELPALSATTLADYCYYYMFYDCSNIRISTTQDTTYSVPYRIPTTGTGTSANEPLKNMFGGTGGNFTGTPNINTTYYLPAPAHTHDMTAHAAVAANCTTSGTSAYWECTGCSKFFSDEEGNNEIVDIDAWLAQGGDGYVAALGHNKTHYAAQAATFDAPGNIEYWYCDRCEKYFSDENCENEITQAQTVIPQKVAVAQYNSTKYETLDAAFAAAGSKAVTLLADIDGYQFTAKTTRKLNLNGYTFTNYTTTVSGYYISESESSGVTTYTHKQYLAKIGGTYYANVVTALADYQAGDVIELLKSNTGYTLPDNCPTTFKVKKGTYSLRFLMPDNTLTIVTEEPDPDNSDNTIVKLVDAPIKYTDTAGKYHGRTDLDGAPGTYELLDDVTLSAAAVFDYNTSASCDYVVDLKGHTLTFDGPTENAIEVYLRSSGNYRPTLTIQDTGATKGKIVNKTATNAAVAVLLAQGASYNKGEHNDVVIDGVEIVSEVGNGVVLGGNDNTLTITDSTITTQAANKIAVSTNGSHTNDCEMTISGSTITSADVGVYLPGDADVTISDTDVTGVNAAIDIKSGSLTIGSGTFTATGDKADYSFNDNGPSATGDAIVVENCGYPGGAPVVTITNGTFISDSADAVASYAYGSNNDEVNNFIEGGNFSSDVSDLVVENKTANTGGTVSGAPFVIVPDTFVVQNKTTGTKYKYLQDAFSAMSSGDTILLLKDTYDSEGISYPLYQNEGGARNNITFDLGGHTLNSTISTYGNNNIIKNGTIKSHTSSRYTLSGGGNLTIAADAEIIGPNPGSWYTRMTVYFSGVLNVYGKIESLNNYAVSMINGGELNVYDGAEIISKESESIDIGSTTNGHPTRIYGGNFTSNSGVSNIFYETGVNLEVSGGTYTAIVPDEIIADGYECFNNLDGTYSVVPEGTKDIEDVLNQFMISADDAKADGNKFGIADDYLNLSLLGVQKKDAMVSVIEDSDVTSEGGAQEAADGDDIRFIAVADTDILRNADDYGFVLAKVNDSHTTENTKFENLRAYWGNGEKTISAKGTYNNVCGDAKYGALEEDTPYKYITCAVNGVEDGSKIAARFWVKIDGKIYYGKYAKNNYAGNYTGCTAGVNANGIV